VCYQTVENLILDDIEVVEMVKGRNLTAQDEVLGSGAGSIFFF
jgi:hypothetical protein